MEGGVWEECKEVTPINGTKAITSASLAQAKVVGGNVRLKVS